MRNVQRTASCGDAIAHDGAREKENCRSNEAESGAIAPGIATEVAFDACADPLFASGSEIGAVFFFEVAQQVLFAQQPAWQAFWLETFDRMQVRAETAIGAAITAVTNAIEIVIRASIELIFSTSQTIRRTDAFIQRRHFFRPEPRNYGRSSQRNHYLGVGVG